nr:uncharacterized protein LOC127315174 [Lolium perenne]
MLISDKVLGPSAILARFRFFSSSYRDADRRPPSSPRRRPLLLDTDRSRRPSDVAALPHPSRSRASSPPLYSPSASSSSSPSSSCDFSPLRRPICSGAASSAVFVDGIGCWRRGSAAGDRERLLATADGIGGWRPDAAGPVRRLRQLRGAAASARWLSLDGMCQNGYLHKKVRLTLIHGDLHSSKVQVFDDHDGKIAILNQMFLLEFQRRREGSSSSCAPRVPAAAGGAREAAGSAAREVATAMGRRPPAGARL